MFQNPKIVLSPTYAYLQQEIRKIPAGDYRILETYCDRRNTVRKIELAGGRIFVLKQYKRPTRLNQFAYTLFRKSKARRAYEYALRLQQLGFETAARSLTWKSHVTVCSTRGIFFRNSSPTRC